MTRKPSKRQSSHRRDSSGNAPLSITLRAAFDLEMEGKKMTSKNVEALERCLAENPEDVASRIKLLGYYKSKRFKDKKARQRYVEHTIWFIDFQPDCVVTAEPWVMIDKTDDKPDYDRVKKHWLRQLQADRPEVLANAAKFFLFPDRKLSEDLLLRAVKLEPDCVKWQEDLSHLYNLSNRPEDALRVLLESMTIEKNETRHFYKMSDVAQLQLAVGQFDEAKGTADRLLNIAEQYRDDWNYGNAVHFANIVQGMVALSRGDMATAGSRLLDAGDTPGSPQLNSFGPSFKLASALLKHGQTKIVIQYLEKCQQFWKCGQKELSGWLSQLQQGTIPDLPTHR